MPSFTAIAATVMGIIAVFFLTMLARGLRQARRAHLANEPLDPGLRFAIGVAGMIGMLGGISSLLFVAALAAEAEGWWKLGPLILVNLVIQPFAALMIRLGVVTLWHTLRGRLVYAGEPIPEEAIPPDNRRFWFIHRAASGIVAVATGCILSLGCLAPLL